MTSWPTRELGDLCRIESSLVDPKSPEFRDLLHVGGANMASDSEELLDLKTAHEEGLISGKYVFDDTMVLYSKIRPYLRKVARPTFRGLCSADIYPLSPKEGLLTRDFLYSLLLSRTFTEHAISVSARAGMPKVNRSQLFSFAASVPSVAEQERIVAILDETLAAIATATANAEKKRDALAELKQSILHKAFSGELTNGGAEACAGEEAVA